MQENGNISPFKKLMQGNPPRLVVLYRLSENGTQEFQWGIVGTIPVLTVIGSIVDAQMRLLKSDFTQEQKCDESAFVIVFTDGGPIYFCHEDITVIPLCGMLETIKTSLVMGRLGQQAAAQQTKLDSVSVRAQILGPNGVPITPKLRGM